MITVHGRFVEIEPHTRLVYTWNWDGAFEGTPETQITVEFHPVGDGTELILRQEELGLPVCTRHLGGWLAACDRLDKFMTAAG
jgi:uncharacterized protein YndB with AHSA1/START domain